MIRLLDIILATTGLLLLWPILVVIYLIGLLDTGSPLFKQTRIGKHQQPFILLKFRTMALNTASVPSHEASSTSITTYGSFLRRTKLDELPQLWLVLVGHMSLVGPRPCLITQVELISERSKRGVFSVRPGITGLAQISKIDMSTPKKLAEVDATMMANLTIRNYFYYIFATVLGKGLGDRVKTHYQ